MNFQILAVRTPDEDDGRLYPLPSDHKGSVRMEQWDGEPLRLTGKALAVRQLGAGTWRTLQHAKGVKLDILITESRVVVSCVKSDRGGSWIGFGGGGVMFAMAANGVSKARATHRRRGKLLVGHVRYPWLRCVGFRPRSGWGTTEEIRLGLVVRSREGARQELFLDIGLPKDVDSRAVARAIVMRAASYRLREKDLPEADRASLQELGTGPSLVAPEENKFALHNLPRYEFVSAASACPEHAVAEPGGTAR